MAKKICLMSFFIFLFLFWSNLSIAQNMKEGLWEITMTMEMSGMPMKLPPQTNTLCLTKKDTVPQKAEPGQECKLTKHEVKGDTVTWVMECKTKEGPVTFNGKVTYKGESFEGVVKMKSSDMVITQNLKGKWIGKCKE